SNNPSEDDHAEAFMKSDDSQWSFFGVYDGHNGWETSALLREELIEAVTKEFTGIDPAKPRTYDTDPYAEAMTRAFKSVDDKIVHERVDEVLQSKKISRSAVINLLAPAWSGSCALLAFYDAKTSMLRVALTGDCRAVLGRRRADGKFDLEVLTIDQTGKNPDEQKRVEAEHPGETVVKDGRILGWPPSRVFGDARWKWSREIQEKLKKYLGRSLVDAVKTPPYFTAEPVVSCTNMKRGDFVILATDGLWDVLTNREVVGLVGAWVHKNEGKTKTSGWWSRWWSAKSAANSLPVVGDAKSSESADKDYYGTKKEFINVDSNAATHLVRNALGGANKDLREALLSMRSPRARTYRDDMTATVVFFG
ncbi:protein serine/threonine phosphatase 2C, partial [Ramaria rubella]